MNNESEQERIEKAWADLKEWCRLRKEKDRHVLQHEKGRLFDHVIYLN